MWCALNEYLFNKICKKINAPHFLAVKSFWANELNGRLLDKLFYTRPTVNQWASRNVPRVRDNRSLMSKSNHERSPRKYT